MSTVSCNTTAALAPLLASQNDWNGNDSSMWTHAILAAMTAVFGAAVLQMNNKEQSSTECCGIAGVVGSLKNHDARYVVND